MLKAARLSITSKSLLLLLTITLLLLSNLNIVGAGYEFFISVPANSIIKRQQDKMCNLRQLAASILYADM